MVTPLFKKQYSKKLLSDFIVVKMDSIARRYVSMSRDDILGFPKSMPRVNWMTYLLNFKNVKGNDVALHLVIFHMHVHRLKIGFLKTT